MKQLLRAGLCMLAVLLALAGFKLFCRPAQATRPVHTPAPTASPISVTLPPPTVAPLPPSPSPTPPPFTTEEELQNYLLEQLAQDGYWLAEAADHIIGFDSVPDGYSKLDGIFKKPDPGSPEAAIYLQYWYRLAPCRIVSLQQAEGAGSVTESFTYENLRLYPHFLTTGWVNYKATYLTSLDGYCITVGLSAIEDVPEDELKFLLRLR